MARNELLISSAAWRESRKRGVVEKKTTLASIDPYFWWHSITDFRAFQPSGDGVQPSSYSFIAEGNLDEFRKWAKDRPITVPAAYSTPLRASTNSGLARYFTISLDIPFHRPSLFAGRQGEMDRHALGLLLIALINCEHLVRLQLGFSRGEMLPDSKKNDNDSYGSQTEAQLEGGAPIAALEPLSQPRRWETNVQVRDACVVIGVIDDGAAFAHATMLEPNGRNSRVKLVWNQTQQISHLNGQVWRTPCDSTGKEVTWYGSALEASNIAALIKANLVHGELDELGCYAALVSDKGAVRALRSRESHGAAVLAAAAGSLDATNVIPLSADASQQMRPLEISDAASRAPVIFVDLPHELITISSGRWMSICALDGVRFIIEQARARFQRTESKSRVPVVINISSGSSAGPHDGSSIFESALTEILKSDPLIAVTLAAGNSRLARCHVVETMIPGVDQVSICLRIPPAKKFETYVEIWPEWFDAAGKKLPDSPETLTLEIESPYGEKRTLHCDDDGIRFREKQANRGATKAEYENNDQADVIAGALFASNVSQSNGRPMALLVVAATAPHERLVSAPFGNWTIRATNKSQHTLRINAWIERDETVYGIRRPQIAHFIKDANALGSVLDWDDITDRSVSRQQTTSNFANADKAFAVAAGVGGRADGFVSSYSGAGAGGSDLYGGRPFFVARADRSPAQPGIPAWGNYRSARRHMNGTSIAAPQVARVIANAFARGNDREYLECLVQYAQPRIHPHLEAIASGEGRVFVDISDIPPSDCKDPTR